MMNYETENKKSILTKEKTIEVKLSKQELIDKFKYYCPKFEELTNE